MKAHPRMNILLMETALELIPHEFYKINAINKLINKHGNVSKILDTTYHHTFMGGLKEKEKRGRPDIFYHYLLDTLTSPANLHGNIGIYFSTTQTNTLYSVNSEMKCPRSFNRFKGLMVKLLRTGAIPNKKPYLIEKMEDSLDSWLHGKNIIQFTTEGTPTKLPELAQTIKTSLNHNEETTEGTDLTIIIGGFQAGHTQDLSRFNPELIKIGSMGYDAAILTQRILSIYELNLNLI